MIDINVLPSKKYQVHWYFRKSDKLHYKYAGFFIIGIPLIRLWINFAFKRKRYISMLVSIKLKNRIK